MNSSSIEEYLEAIYKLQADGPVRQCRLAEHLGLSPAAVAEMVKKMISLRLVQRNEAMEMPEKSSGRLKSENMALKLTAQGEKEALELIRKHRLSERLLTDILGLPWEKAHQEACKFEHVLSPEVEESLVRLLHDPKHCPHGHPIPDRNGLMESETTRPLTDLKPKETATIVLVGEDDPEMLKYLATLGLLPDIEITIEEIGPFNGPLLVKAGGARYALGREVASKIMVKEAI